MKLYRSPRTRAFRAGSPMGKVPALVDGETRLRDSGAICLYPADANPESGLGVPVGDPRRGAFLQWTIFTNSVVEPAIGEKASGQEPDRRRHGYGSFERMVDTPAAGPGDGPWILGTASPPRTCCWGPA